MLRLQRRSCGIAAQRRNEVHAALTRPKQGAAQVSLLNERARCPPYMAAAASPT